MGYFDNFNRGSRFAADTSAYAGYVKLSDLPSTDRLGQRTRFWIAALYINTKSRYGDSPVAAVSEGNGTGFFVNLPAHELDTVRAMMGDEKAVSLINNGKAYFTVEPYTSRTHNRECLGVRWGSVE